jgi:hypothetical protein
MNSAAPANPASQISRLPRTPLPCDDCFSIQSKPTVAASTDRLKTGKVPRPVAECIEVPLRNVTHEAAIKPPALPHCDVRSIDLCTGDLTNYASDMLDFWQPDELQELGEIRATMPPEGRSDGDVVQVRLRAVATDTGTLELTAVAVNGDGRWKIEFDVRSNG